MTEDIEYKELDFKVIQEPWNKYQLDNGTIIKNRYVLIKISIAIRKNQNIDIKINRRVLASSLFVNRKYISDPTEIPHPDNWSKYIVDFSLKYRTIFEEWNEYLLFDNDDKYILRVKSTVTNISRTSLIREDRIPIFIVDSTEQSILRKIDRSK